MTLETKMNLCKLGRDGEDEAHNVLEMQQVGWGAVQFSVPCTLLLARYLYSRGTVVVCFFRSKPRLCILADSDEESSSAGSSDEEEAPPSEIQGSVGEKNPTVAAEG